MILCVPSDTWFRGSKHTELLLSDPEACSSVAVRHASWNMEPGPRCTNACIYISCRSREGFTSPAMHDPSLLTVMVSTSRAQDYTAEH